MPKRKATRLLVYTARTRIIFMSATGSLTRSSTAIHTTTRTSPTALSNSVVAANQPHNGASETARSSATNQAGSSNAAQIEIPPGERSVIRAPRGA